MPSTHGPAPIGGTPRRLRLALVYDCLYPRTIGGIEHRNAQLAAALAGRGHAVTLFGMGEVPPAVAGVEVIALGPRRSDGTSRTARDSARFALAMARLPLERFDVVEAANIPFAHLFPLALRCRVRRVPLVVTWHEVWGENWRRFLAGSGLVSWWKCFAGMEWLAAQLGDRVNAVSALTAARLATLRSGDRVTVVPNGIPFAEIEACATAGAQTHAASPLVAAGRLLAHKRVDLLLRAVARLPITGSTPILTVIGDGPEQPRLEALTRELGIADRVRFAGRLPSDRDVWRLLGGAAIAVQPSAREGFGIFPLEAMAAGLPVVYCAAPDSAVRELVRGGREGVEALADPADLARVIGDLLNDPERLRALGAAARERAREFDWSAVAARFKTLLDDLLEGS